MSPAQLTLALLLLCCLASLAGAVETEHLRRKIDALDLIKARGFRGEIHTIMSTGVQLTVYHIINPLAEPTTLNRYPVIYGHGVLYDASSMLSSSDRARPRKPLLGQPTVYYGNQPDGSDDRSLPFMLSNNNFDVWLFDARGTNDNNRNLSSQVNFAVSNHFWDFSLDDQSLIDLPKIIDYVLRKCEAEKFVYVGYSESTFFLLALLTTTPAYADKLAAAALMAPVAYVAHIKGLTVPLLGPSSVIVPEFIQYNFFPQPVIDAVDLLLRSLCSSKPGNNIVCGSIFKAIGGNGVGANSPHFFIDFFKSTSVKAIKHFLQLFVSRKFAMYDFGPIENMRRYGRPIPPLYDLSKLRSDRIILVRGLSDFLSTPEDQAVLMSEMGVKPFGDIVVPNYNHFDFIDGQDVVALVNGPVLSFIYQLLYKDGMPYKSAAAPAAAALAVANATLLTETATPSSGLGTAGLATATTTSAAAAATPTSTNAVSTPSEPASVAGSTTLAAQPAASSSAAATAG